MYIQDICIHVELRVHLKYSIYSKTICTFCVCFGESTTIFSQYKRAAASQCNEVSALMISDALTGARAKKIALSQSRGLRPNCEISKTGARRLPFRRRPKAAKINISLYSTMILDLRFCFDGCDDALCSHFSVSSCLSVCRTVVVAVAVCLSFCHCLCLCSCLCLSLFGKVTASSLIIDSRQVLSSVRNLKHRF